MHGTCSYTCTPPTLFMSSNESSTVNHHDWSERSRLNQFSLALKRSLPTRYILQMLSGRRSSVFEGSLAEPDYFVAQFDWGLIFNVQLAVRKMSYNVCGVFISRSFHWNCQGAFGINGVVRGQTWGKSLNNETLKRLWREYLLPDD